MNTELTAVDGLGQNIHVGDKVVWMSSYGAYGKLTVYIVRGITPKRVALSNLTRFKQYPECRPTYAAHNVVLVVNEIVKDMPEYYV